MSCPRTLMSMPPSKVGWQSMAVMSLAIFWKVSAATFSMILTVPCICWPSNVIRDCSAWNKRRRAPVK